MMRTTTSLSRSALDRPSWILAPIVFVLSTASCVTQAVEVETSSISLAIERMEYPTRSTDAVIRVMSWSVQVAGGRSLDEGLLEDGRRWKVSFESKTVDTLRSVLEERLGEMGYRVRSDGAHAAIIVHDPTFEFDLGKPHRSVREALIGRFRRTIHVKCNLRVDVETQRHGRISSFASHGAEAMTRTYMWNEVFRPGPETEKAMVIAFSQALDKLLREEAFFAGIERAFEQSSLGG